MSPRPTAPPVQTATIPAELRSVAQWVCWRYELRKEKWTKVPFRPCGSAAASTDRTTWTDFDSVCSAYANRTSRFDGIGFVFSADDRFTGIDLDGCIDEAGNIVPSAREVVEALNSYAEVSPSQRGVKVFIAGDKGKEFDCRSKAIPGYKETEIYTQDRFFTVTGLRLHGIPTTVESRQTELDALCLRLWPRKNKRVLSTAFRVPAGAIADDDRLIKRACAAHNGDRFKQLWAGDTSAHRGDHSGADQALCNYLAFWTGKDAARMDRLFRLSGLMRPKWNERRGERTYGQMTIECAIADCVETYSPGSLKVAAQNGKALPGGISQKEDGQEVPLGERDPHTGRLVLSPRRTLPTAEAYVREFHQIAQHRTLHGYGGLLLEWRGNHYTEIEDESVKHRLQPWLHNALRYEYNSRTHQVELVDFESNPNTVRHVLETIRSFVHLPASTVTPSWLSEAPDQPPALEILPCKTSNLHIPTSRVLNATPALFTINALDFDYDPDPDPPESWIKFLERLFGDDLESVELLQDWMGYCLTSDTRQQKILLLVGPRRSGKGTIARVLTRLVGAGNVAGPTTSGLARPFGLQPLIDKSLAIVSDARFNGENIAIVVERLLCISGEDALTIDRKFLSSVTMKLATRFMFLTNELPRLNDASTALAGRFLVLRLTHSFYDQEDTGLTQRLLGELPGILKWALEGWKRLQERGRFFQPASSSDAIQDLEELSSPVHAFVREHCVTGPGHRVDLDRLYQIWTSWCQQEGRTVVTHKGTFGRDLVAAVPGVRRRRGTGLTPFYDGIGLRSLDL